MSSNAELRQLLKEDATGKNLYDHLTETLMKILLEKPKSAYDKYDMNITVHSFNCYYIYILLVLMTASQL